MLADPERLNIAREAKSPFRLSGSMVTRDGLWILLQRAALALREQVSGPTVTFQVQTGGDPRFQDWVLARDPLTFLPDPKEADWETYVERVNGEVDGAPWSLRVRHLNGLDFSLCEAARAFLLSYLEVNGVRYSANLDVLVGTGQPLALDAPPDAIDEVFQFVAVGQPRYRYWTAAQAMEDPGLIRCLKRSGSVPEQELEAAAELQLQEQTTAYWPESTLYVRDATRGEFQASLLVQLTGPYSTLERMVHRGVEEILKTSVGRCFLTDDAPGHGSPLESEVIQEACRKVETGLRDSLQDLVQRQWASAGSGACLGHPDVPQKRSPEPSDHVRVRKGTLIYSVQGQHLLVGCMGRTLRAPTAIQGLLEDLRTSDSLRIKELQSRHSPPMTEQGLIDLLLRLAKAGGIEIIPDGEP